MKNVCFYSIGHALYVCYMHKTRTLLLFFLMIFKKRLSISRTVRNFAKNELQHTGKQILFC